MQFVCQCTVDAGLSAFPGRFQEHGKDGEENGHKGRVPGQVRVHRPRVDRVHRHLGACGDNKRITGRLFLDVLRPSALALTFGTLLIVASLSLTFGSKAPGSSSQIWRDNVAMKKKKPFWFFFLFFLAYSEEETCCHPPKGA